MARGEGEAVLGAFLYARESALWDRYRIARATIGLRYLSKLHLEIVQATARPVIEAGDVGTTSDLYTKLTNNSSLPDGYGFIRGTLTEARLIKPFDRPDLTFRIDAVLF